MSATRHCFCNFCRGTKILTKAKVRQHTQVYGVWDADRVNAGEGPSTSRNTKQARKVFETADSDSEEVETINVQESEDVNDTDSPKVAPTQSLRSISNNWKAFLEKIELEYLDVEPIPVVENSETSDWESDESSFGSESEEEEMMTVLAGTDAVTTNIANNLSGEILQDVDEAISNSPLLHNSLTCTLFETLVQLFHWFSSHPSLSKEAFSRNLQLWHSILPEGNLLPTSYRNAYKIIQPYLNPEIIYDVCPNDCILFRGEYKDMVKCPKCNDSRFKGSKARRTFHYLPLGQRLVRNFGAENISQILQNHSGEINAEDTEGTMNDIHDSPRWKEIFASSGVFNGDPRGVALSLCLDGLNPWSKNKATYSMWPIVLGQLNLPRSMRYNFANLILVGIIPSQSHGKEPKHLDPYLEVFVDEIIYLSGREIYDAYQKAPFHVKVEIIIYIHDYQGMGKVFSLTGTGSYRGCAWCMMKGQYCKHLHKVAYPGNRRFLPADHELRNDCSNFPDQAKELRKCPPARNFQQDISFHKAYDNAKSKAQSSKLSSATDCKGMYMFADKNPGFDRVQQTMPDAMHTIAVQVKHLFKCIAGKHAEDCLAVRMPEKSLGRFEESWPKNDSSELPTPSYGLTKKQMEIADERAKQVLTPTGDIFCPGPIFSRISRLTSHEWKEIASRGILKFCVRDMLGKTQQESLTLFMDAIAALCAPSHDKIRIQLLQEQVDVALARLERDFPLSLQVITNHIIHHLPEGIERFGPVRATWMFGFERFNSWLCRRAMNRRHPEATILRTYQVYINEIPEFRSLWTVYNMEKENARKQRRVKLFPKFGQWRPEGSRCNPLDSKTTAILEGLQPTVVIYQHYVVENKQHSRNSIYISKEHQTKVASIVHLRPTSLTASDNTSQIKVGVIEQLFEHNFAQRKFVWAAVALFKDSQFEPSCGLWFSSVDSICKTRVLVLLSSLSHPLTSAYDGNKIWLLDLYP